MPKKSGLRFLYELRHHDQWANIPVLIVTAHAHDELGKQDLQGILAGRSLTGPRVYLEKPVEPEAYVRAVCESMGLQFDAGQKSANESELRRQVATLMQDADAEKLAEVMSVLKRKS
jgi:response regulator RpfG family c-di-GMP phosphodiesterase